MIDDKWLAISQALIGWMADQAAVQSLALKALEIDPSLEPHPRYPVDPLTYCDRLVLRNYTADVGYRTSRGSAFVYKGSLFYYRLQVPGQNHQVVLTEAVRLLCKTLQAAITPTPVQQAGADCIRIVQEVVRDQLRHAFDEPRLRVSVAEIFVSSDAESH